MGDFWDRLLYRKEERGVFEKDGKSYKRFFKTRRWPWLSRRRALIALAVLAASLLVCRMLCCVADAVVEPAAEEAVPVG